MTIEETTEKLRGLEAKVIDLQLAALQKSADDHERRLRLVEETSTRFNLLLMLTVGGGLLSLINLLNTLFTFGK
jgi:hypothetical protein